MKKAKYENGVCVFYRVSRALALFLCNFERKTRPTWYRLHVEAQDWREESQKWKNIYMKRVLVSFTGHHILRSLFSGVFRGKPTWYGFPSPSFFISLKHAQFHFPTFLHHTNFLPLNIHRNKVNKPSICLVNKITI